MAAAPEKNASRGKRAMLALAIGSVLGVVVLEGGLRILLLSESPSIARIAAPLRDPALWADAKDESAYWKLSYLWRKSDRRRNMAPRPDEVVGWRTALVEDDYSHRLSRFLEDQRPVLLYGDSFANCLTPMEDCFQQLMRESDLFGEYILFNYGTGGYGLDQIYLLLRESIERYADRDPVVIFSFLVDDDLDRMLLDFRELPKPTLSFAGDELIANPPIAFDADELMQKSPPRARSWFWQLLLHGTELVPEDYRPDAEKLQRKKRLTRAVFEAVQEELDGRGIEWFVLFFHSKGPARALRPVGWQETFALETLEELGIRYVTTRPDLWDVTLENGGDIEVVYLQPPTLGHGHLNALGNEAAFRTMRRGILGESDAYEFRAGRRE